MTKIGSRIYFYGKNSHSCGKYHPYIYLYTVCMKNKRKYLFILIHIYCAPFSPTLVTTLYSYIGEYILAYIYIYIYTVYIHILRWLFLECSHSSINRTQNGSCCGKMIIDWLFLFTNMCVSYSVFFLPDPEST